MQNIMAANSDQTAKRRGKGKPFVKGESGNASGRPKLTPEVVDLVAACKGCTFDALAVLTDIMENGENERNRITAAMAIIERGHGRPIQPTTIEGSLSVRSAKDLTDDELAAIAAGSGARAAIQA